MARVGEENPPSFDAAHDDVVKGAGEIELRVHGENHTVRVRAHAGDFARVLKEALDRRRGKA
jgi:hypothetical protein